MCCFLGANATEPLIAVDQRVWRCVTMCGVVDDLWWRDEDAEYIRHRSDRYPGATDIDPEWTLEAAADPRRVVHDPDPKSRTGAIRICGFSPSAGFVVTVIATGRAHAGVTARKSSGVICGTTRGRDEDGRQEPDVAAAGPAG